MRLKFRFLLLTLCLVPAVLPADSVTVRRSHDSTVTVIEHRGTDLVATGAADGKVMIRVGSDYSLTAALQVSHLPIRLVAIHPTQPRLAIVSSDGSARHLLHLWDWVEQREITRRRLSDMPFFLRFSDKGSYFFYGLPAFKSLTFISSDSGNEVPYLPDGFGFVSFAVTSADETVLVTYTPGSGRIAYWDLPNNRRLPAAREDIQSQRNLRDLQALGRALFAGIRGDEIIVVHNFTGRVVARAEQEGLLTLSSRPSPNDPDEYQLAALVETEDGPGFETFTLSGSSLRSTYFSTRYIDADTSAMAYTGLHAMSGTNDGELHLFRSTAGRPQAVESAPVEPARSIAFSRDRMFVTFEETLRAITSDLFLPRPPGLPEVAGVTMTDRRLFGFETPRIRPLDETSLLAWSTGPETSELARISSISRAVFDRAEVNLPDLISVTATEEEIALVDASGRLRIIDTDDYETRFAYRAPGLRTALDTDYFGIAVGKSASGRFDSALITLDTQTGETVPIATEAFMVFSLAFDRRGRSLYSLGLSQENGSVETILSVHFGRDLERNRVIYRYPGELAEGTLHFDEESGLLYTTINQQTVSVWDGAELRDFSPVQHRPLELAVQAGNLYSLNADGTISAWLTESGDQLMDLYFFEDDQWIALSAAGYFLESDPGIAEEYLSFVPSGRRTLDDYRLELPILNHAR